MSQENLPPLLALVVEDQNDIAQSTAELLALCGYRVRVATSGPEALLAADEAIPDIVLLDIGLPGMDGWEVARQLRNRSVGKQPFVVAVTGYGGDGDRWRSADAGVDMHLTKPADPARLTALLAWIRQVRAQVPACAAGA